MKNKGLNILILLSCLVILNSSFVLGQEKYDLKLNFEVEDEYKLETVITQDIKQSFMGMEINMEQEIELAYNFIVKEITPAGNYIISVEYTEFDLDISNFSMDDLAMPQRQGIEENDEAEIEKELDEFSQDFIGQEFKLELSKQGDVISISNYEEITEEILAGVDDPTAKENLAEVSNEEYLRESWEQFLTYLPQQEVAVGDSWESSFEINHPIAIEVLNNYKLEAVNDENIIISFGTDSKTNNISLKQEKNEEMEFDFQGQQSGNIILNSESNWIEEMNLTQEISGFLSISLDQQGQQLRIPMELTTELKANGKKL